MVIGVSWWWANAHRRRTYTYSAQSQQQQQQQQQQWWQRHHRSRYRHRVTLRQRSIYLDVGRRCSVVIADWTRRSQRPWPHQLSPVSLLCEYCNRTDTGRLPAEWTVADRWCCRSCDRESFSLSSLLLKQRTAMIRTLLAWKDNQVCTTCARRPLDEIIGCVARVFNSNVHGGWHFNPVRALKHSSVLR